MTVLQTSRSDGRWHILPIHVFKAGLFLVLIGILVILLYYVMFGGGIGYYSSPGGVSWLIKIRDDIRETAASIGIEAGLLLQILGSFFCAFGATAAALALLR